MEKVLCCKAIEVHFGAALRSAIAVDNDNTFVDIKLDPKTAKKYMKATKGVTKPCGCQVLELLLEVFYL